jgi:hypothetical protein
MSLGRSLLLLGVAAVGLTACGEMREDLGLGRNMPDEFAVVDRAPLSMPPDFALRPPRPGAARPQEVATDRQASAALFGNEAAGKEADASEAEKALLEASGAAKADPAIRDTVDRESAQKVVASDHLIQQLLDWGKSEKQATTVDAVAEAERIKKNKETDQPITAGGTPVIEKKKTGWLGL